MQHDAQRRRGLAHLAGHGKVVRRGRGIAARVVVHQDQPHRVQFQRPPNHLARIDRRVVDGAAALRLVGLQPVAAVQEQHADLLDRLARQDGGQIADQRVPVGQHRPVQHLRPRQAQRGGLHQLQRRGTRLAEPLDAAQIGHRGGDRARVAAEARHQHPGNRLGVAPGQGEEQHHLQHFVVRQRVGAGGQQPLAKPRPVAVRPWRAHSFR